LKRAMYGKAPDPGQTVLFTSLWPTTLSIPYSLSSHQCRIGNTVRRAR
jgi:hypothetical protein